MSDTNATGFGTIMMGVIAVGLIVLGGFCCCGRLSSNENYTPSFNSSPSSSTSSSSTPSGSSPDLSSPESSVKKAVVITQNANLRKSNSANSKVIQTISEGTNVEIVKQDGAWFLVKNDGQSGWMHGNTIRLVNPSPSYSGSDSTYERTRPGYDPNAPLLPREKGDIEPLYNEVQRLKEQEGMTDKEAVDKILRDAGEIP